MSSEDRWIGAYSIGPTILGKLSCPNKNNNNKTTVTNNWTVTVIHNIQKLELKCLSLEINWGTDELERSVSR
jgi:hypothetical protein